jgi:exosortase/archaeosortase family protein
MLKKFEKNYFKILKYLLKFLALSIPIIFIYSMNFYGLQRIYAIVNKFFLEFFNINAIFFDSFTSSGLSPSLYYEQKIIRIDSACTGIRSFYLLFAMLFAFKDKLNKKFKYLIFGALVLFVVNILRIFISSLLFFNNFLGFDSFLWTTSLNLTTFVIIYFFIKDN